MGKKLLACLIILVMIVGVLTACGGNSGNGGSAAAPGGSAAAPGSSAAAPADVGKGKTIGYLGWDVQADWNKYSLAGLQWGAAQKGIDVKVLDAKVDAEKQVNQAEELISSKVDFIAMFPVTPESGATITRMANEAGIPITVENTFLPDDGSAGDIVGQVACKYDDIGYAAVKYTAENFPGAKLLYVTGGLGLGVTEVYKIGVQRALDEFGDKVTIVGEVNGNFVTEDSYNVTQDFITSGKSDFNVVFAQNDAQAKGVYNALKEAGMEKIPILSTGGAPEGYDMLQAGQEQANMTAPANLQGIIQFRYIWAYLNGQPIAEKKIPLPVIPIDLKNAGEWINWDDMDAGYKYVSENIGPFVP